MKIVTSLFFDEKSCVNFLGVLEVAGCLLTLC